MVQKMIGQFYEDGIFRIFKDNCLLHDFSGLEYRWQAEVKYKKLNLKKIKGWVRTDWGWECNITVAIVLIMILMK